HSLLIPIDPNKNIIVTSEIEHSAIVSASKYYETLGYKVIKVETLSNGMINEDSLKKIINEHGNKIALVCIMAANNETGVIQPNELIAKLCNENDITYFSDTTQFIGKTEFNFEKS